ncbi:hypothetical protein HPHPP15B_1160 [Helicobacter pylori Hp P-15b]|uniref:Uncharacterized protein n=1 Tax=Helicobacter pylori Hp P-15 TaxID=992080 RepID=J0F687_HELPX|nr:hypothetical protein HPHPP15_0892 [Helicobacter pylori Hp P-15]EJC32326.1 hypothetical protein HPHPP15B_1160 [Helicobacter pylori Hp P-15b]
MVLFLLSVGYEKILHFLRLDNREPDFIKRYFLKRSLGDFSCRGQLFQNAPYFLKRMSLK